MSKSIFILFLLPVTVFSQQLKDRVYKDNETFRYRLTTESFNNNASGGITVAVSQHKVIKDSGRFTEEIRWISKKTFTKKDTVSYDSIAAKVKTYRVSLVPGADLELPPLTIPAMTGEITDLHTFYAAVSPALHMTRLSDNNPSFKDSVVRGKFGDGKEIIMGEDCIQVTQKLIKQDKDYTVVETSFTPPAEFSIKPLVDTIAKKTFSQFNNFQMIRKGMGDKVNLMWGIEEFIITSVIENKTGKLIKADMINLLQLRMRFNSTADLKAYDAEIPVNIKRVLKLELLPAGSL